MNKRKRIKRLERMVEVLHQDFGHAIEMSYGGESFEKAVMEVVTNAQREAQISKRPGLKTPTGSLQAGAAVPAAGGSPQR